jgi:SAM-dependent methyltransferase
MEDVRAQCLAVVGRFERRECSAAIALMEMLLASEDVDLVEQLLRGRDDELVHLFSERREGCRKLVAGLHAEPSLDGARAPEQVLAYQRALFDGWVARDEATSVAFYSLGSPELLARATDEVVEWLYERGLLAEWARVLDLGCGIGRMELALHDRVASLDAIDLSPRMVDVARVRCAELANVRVTLADGQALDFAAKRFDLVLAIDSVPYMVQAGEPVIDGMFAEIARVLAPGGVLAVLNFSYRGDVAADAAHVGALAARHGLHVEIAGAQPFKLWNASAFVLRALA